jgi:signal transduction histidine kinase
LLTNITKHSRATGATVKVDGNAAYIRLQVSDNGTGGGKSFKPGLGLSGLRERVHTVGGTLSINTGAGFTVVTVLPKG